MPEVRAKSSPSIFLLYLLPRLHSFSETKCKLRPCRERKKRQTVCHMMSIPVLILHVRSLCFGWSCHYARLFRCTNMGSVGKSNQDLKIMTCYVHKHMLFYSRHPVNKFQVYLNHFWSGRPCSKRASARATLTADFEMHPELVCF